MAYTFGAATADDITWSPVNTAFAGNRVMIVCGWWYPTTLTATRGLWSCGAINGAEIDTTTSEIRLRTDNTTDGQWTTTGVGLAVNTWSFLAFMASCNNTGPAGAWRVWACGIDGFPTEVTVTSAVSPVGNFAGTNSFTVGNKGTGTLAFQGDIAEVCFLQSGATSGILSPFNFAAYGTITQAEADWALAEFVVPCFRGEVFPRRAINVGGAFIEPNYWSGRDLATVQRSMYNTANDTAGLAPTIDGATPTANHPPVSARHSPLMLPTVRR